MARPHNMIMTLSEILKELNKETTERVKEDVHFSDEELRAFRQGAIDQKVRDSMFKHLCDCGKCMKRMWDMDPVTQEGKLSANGCADDYLYLAVAAGPKESSFSELTKKERYRISYSKRTKEEGRGMVNLEVQPDYQEEREGKWLILKDASGKPIIHGKVESGTIPGNTVDYNEFDWDKLTVWIIQDNKSQDQTYDDSMDTP